MNIVLEPHKMNSVALKLREESEDYYLFFVCMYRTGYTGSKLLGMKSKDLEDFISANTEFLSETFIDELRIHNISKEPNDALFCNADEQVLLRKPGLCDTMSQAGETACHNSYDMKMHERHG